MDELALLKRKLQREQAARAQAESILEKKSLELYHANEQLQKLNEQLEATVAARTAELDAIARQYRQIVENANDLIYRTDADGIITYVNQVATLKYGFEEHEVIGRSFTQFIHPDHLEEVDIYYNDVVDHQKSESYFEFPIKNKAGEKVWLGQNVQLLVEDGQVKQTVAVARDITDRKLAETRLLKTKSRLRALISNLQAGILVEDENREVVLTNQEFCHQFSIPVPPEQLIGADCAAALEAAKSLFKKPDAFVERIDELLAARKVVVSDELHMTDGTIFERDYIPIYVQEEYYGHLWQYRDVTERKRAAAQLRESEEKYRGIMENMELGLLEVDREQTILRAYHSFCEMTGYTSAELVGQNAVEIFLPDNYEAIMRDQDAERQAGKPGVYELQIRKKDGSLIWVMISGAPIFDPKGNMVGSIGIHYDITDRKLLEKALREAKIVAEEARAAEQLFLARMSHEIRTPLNAIVGMTHLLYDTQPNQEQQEYLSVLKRSADILSGLISDILDFSKIQAGEMQVQATPFDLVGLVQALEKTFRLQLENRPVAIRAEVDPAITTLLLGDELLLNQILINLLGNAVKFTEEGFIALRVKVVAQQEHTLTIHFEVQDTGIGIPEDKLNLIFQSFKQVAGGHRHKYGGTGLGLAITKQLVELLDGDLVATSALGKGTTFSFRLSLTNTHVPIPSVEEENLRPLAPRKEKVSILVAEDNHMNRKYISTLLRKWDYTFDMAHNGREAVENAKLKRFDLILMDISMPEMDGYEATINIRNTANPNQNTPIVALTASALKAMKHKSLQAGMTDFLTKPFQPKQLQRIIHEQVLQKRSPAQEAEPTPTTFSFHPMLDHQQLLAFYEEDLEYAAEMFETFLSYSLQEFKKIDTLISKNTLTEAAKQTHKVKPAFHMVGLTSMAEELDLLEKMMRQFAPLSEIESVYLQIVTATENVVPILEKDLERMKEQLQ
jgi:PAS domain S-box-containing protein